jgi:hypothetical protein
MVERAAVFQNCGNPFHVDASVCPRSFIAFACCECFNSSVAAYSLYFNPVCMVIFKQFIPVVYKQQQQQQQAQLQS